MFSFRIIVINSCITWKCALTTKLKVKAGYKWYMNYDYNYIKTSVMWQGPKVNMKNKLFNMESLDQEYSREFSYLWKDKFI